MYEPKKVGKGYKVFRVKDGKLYPPMVANAEGKDTPIGVWLDAEEGTFAGVSKTGRPQVKSIGSGTLAYRPGWHLSDTPRAKQFDRLNKETGEYEFPKNFVWAECEYAMDKNYQDEADAQGYMRTKRDEEGNIVSYKSDKYQHSLAGLPKLPTGGYYKYRTNPNPDTVPWVITGQMKVNKLLSDEEVNKILASKGVEPIHRQGGDKTLKELGLQESLNESILTNNIYITDNPYRVKDLLNRTKEPIRILYDINKDIYMMGDANDFIHRELIEYAIMHGYYGNDLKRYEIDSYVYDDYDEDDNLKQNVIYIVFAPKGNNDTVGGELGSDGYFEKYSYDIGDILTRDDYNDAWKTCELNKVLGGYKTHTYKSDWDEEGRPMYVTENMLMEDIPAVMKNYPKIPEDIFYQLIKLDPTYKEGSNSVGTYGKWLLNLFNKKALKKEDFYKVPEYLKEFEKKKKWMSNKDIGQFKTLGDLAQALENTQEGELSQNQKDKQFKKEIKNADLNADLVYEDDKWEVWVPNDYESSCKIATNTQWCTGPSSHGSSYYYDKYTSSGNLYIIINKQNNDEKYQFHFPSGQYMDRYDRRIDKDKFLSSNEGLKTFLDGEEKRAEELLKEKAKGKLKELIEEFKNGTINNKTYLNRLVNSLAEIVGEDQEENIFSNAYKEYFDLALPSEENQYFITISKEDIADRYCRYPNDGRDMREDFFKACFEGDLWDYWYEGDADADIDSSLLDEYSRSTLKKLGFPENIYELIEKDEVPEEFEDDEYELNDCFRFASQRASTDGAINEALSDFRRSMESALDDVFKDTVWEIDNDGVEIDSINSSNLTEYSGELADNLRNYSGTFSECFPYTMAEVIAGNLHFNEPYYGWYGFDEDIFNDELQNLLYDSFGDREKTTESLKESLTPKGRLEDKKILDLIWECVDTINEKTGFDIEDDIEFKWGDSTKTLGTMTAAFYEGHPYTLTLNKRLFTLSDDTIKNTIYHELCHYIVYKLLLEEGVWLYQDGRLCQDNKRYRQGEHGGHGSLWKDVAKSIGKYTGQEITRLSSNDEVNSISTTDYKYEVVCKNCGCTLKYQKKTDFVKDPNAKSEFGDWYKWQCGKCHAKGQFEVHQL